jgi:hypothetical protein
MAGTRRSSLKSINTTQREKPTARRFPKSGRKTEGVEFGLQAIHFNSRNGSMYIADMSMSAPSNCRRPVNGFAELFRNRRRP